MTLGPAGGKTGSKIRRGRGFRSAGETARKRLGEAAAGHGFAEPEVLMRWPEVVGERLSGLCVPVKVSYPRAGRLGATLVVRVEGARATEVEHLGPRIIERVNQFYGYRAIDRLKVTQITASGGFAEGQASFAGRPRAAVSEPSPPEPSPAAQARAAEMTRGIENETLRAALTQMGAHVLARGESPRARTWAPIRVSAARSASFSMPRVISAARARAAGPGSAGPSPAKRPGSSAKPVGPVVWVTFSRSIAR